MTNSITGVVISKVLDVKGNAADHVCSHKLYIVLSWSLFEVLKIISHTRRGELEKSDLKGKERKKTKKRWKKKKDDEFFFFYFADHHVNVTRRGWQHKDFTRFVWTVVAEELGKVGGGRKKDPVHKYAPTGDGDCNWAGDGVLERNALPPRSPCLQSWGLGSQPS